MRGSGSHLFQGCRSATSICQGSRGVIWRPRRRRDASASSNGATAAFRLWPFDFWSSYAPNLPPPWPVGPWRSSERPAAGSPSAISRSSISWSSAGIQEPIHGCAVSLACRNREVGRRCIALARASRPWRGSYRFSCLSFMNDCVKNSLRSSARSGAIWRQRRHPVRRNSC